MKPFSFFLIVLLLPGTLAANAKELLFIGSGNNEGEGGVYVCEFVKGKLSAPRKVLSLPRGIALTLSPDKKKLYVSLRASKGQEDGELLALKTGEGGSLEEINRVPLKVDHFCSMKVSKAGNLLLGASYGSGAVSSYALNTDGKIDREVSHIALPRFPQRKKESARAHDVDFNHDGMFAFVPDIANNRIYTFAVNPESGALTQKGFTTSDAFQGTRHLVLNRDSSLLYVLNQMGSSVVGFRHDGKGHLTEFQSIPSIPDDYDGPQNHSAEILFHSSEKFLYASNRGHNSLAVFQVSEKGILTRVQTILSGGEAPGVLS